MSDELLDPITKQWLDWAAWYTTATTGMTPIEQPGYTMENADAEHLEADPIHWLHHFHSWMGYYNSQGSFWKAVFETLDGKYSSLLNQQVSEYLSTGGTSVSKAEYIARHSLRALREARTIADNRSRKWLTDYYSATARRDTASRSVTVRESDRRTTKQW